MTPHVAKVVAQLYEYLSSERFKQDTYGYDAREVRKHVMEVAARLDDGGTVDTSTIDFSAIDEPQETTITYDKIREMIRESRANQLTLLRELETKGVRGDEALRQILEAIQTSAGAELQQH